MKLARIGSRGSALALQQANHIRDRLQAECRTQAEVITIRTAGDRNTQSMISALGSKGVFVKEIEEALLGEEIDIAVHSLKDVPTQIPKGLVFPAIIRRLDARDCLISRSGNSLVALPHGARIGTGSLRRQAQLRHAGLRMSRDWEIVELRGNVDTRLRKLTEGEYDAIVLARAGMERLGLAARSTETLPISVMLPAAGQGAVCVETRAENTELIEALAALDDAETRACVTAERALLARLEGGCQVPLGALAQLENGVLKLEAGVFALDGSDAVRESAAGEAAHPEELGERLADALLKAGAGRLLELAGRSVV